MPKTKQKLFTQNSIHVQPLRVTPVVRHCHKKRQGSYILINKEHELLYNVAHAHTFSAHCDHAMDNFYKQLKFQETLPVSHFFRKMIKDDYAENWFSHEGIENVMKSKERWLTKHRLQLDDVYDGHLNLTPKQKRWFQSLGKRLPTPKPLVKKEFRQLSEDERNRFFSALKRMRQERPDSENLLSEYDILVGLHGVKGSPGAHLGAAFLPWHREYLYRFERALRKYDSTITIPFWDPTLESRLSVPEESYLFTEELLGSLNGFVMIRNLGLWYVSENCHDLGPFLHRNATSKGDKKFIYNDKIFKHILSPKNYRFGDIVSFVDDTLESGHNHVHAWIGGHFNSLICSTQDPAFWFLHTLVDCLWEAYRQNFQKTPLTSDYPTNKDGFVGSNAHDASSPMVPFAPWINIDGLSNFYTDNYYKCGKRPLHCQKDTDCGSKYLWCDKNHEKCMPKIKLGAHCTDYPQTACYQGRCINSTCQVPMQKPSSSMVYHQSKGGRDTP